MSIDIQAVTVVTFLQTKYELFVKNQAITTSAQIANKTSAKYLNQRFVNIFLHL